jgi:HEAT repeat protein
MPLIRKPAPASAPTSIPTRIEGTSDQRWAAARAAAGRPNGVAVLAEALAREDDRRVREAIFTGLTRIATPESAAAIVPYLRSEDAALRTGAIDALRAMPAAASVHLPRLLADPEADVRLLSCELARDLPEEDANRLLCTLLEAETEKNVCAAAIEVLAEIGRADALPALARCAARFGDDPFIAFSVKIATDRIVAQVP